MKSVINFFITLLVIIIFFYCFYLLDKLENFENKRKFAVMWASTLNVGDDFQTLAAINLLEKNNINEYTYIDREKLKEYDGEPVHLIANGWYMHDITKFPPSDKITPIFISVYIDNPLIVSNNVEYFKKYEPIGCRDMSTKKLFEKYGIKSYLSRCLTLCFDEHNKKTDNIYVVDIEGSNGGKSFNDVKINLNSNNVKYIKHNHEEIIKHKLDIKKRLEIARDLLDKYREAKLVITSRLHATLPCRAFNTDVKFLHSNYNTDKRFIGLHDVLNGSNNPVIEEIPSKIERSVINKYKNDINIKFKELINSN